jgi:hypothetical protein
MWSTEDKISLAKECYSMKLELLTNATVVDDAIRFVSQKSKEKLKPSGSGNEMTRKNQMRMTITKTKIS